MANSVTTPVRTPLNYDAWLPMPEVETRTGMSQRTIYRMVQEGKLRQASRPIPGRRPLPIFHPDDVATFEEQRVKGSSEILPPSIAKARSVKLLAGGNGNTGAEPPAYWALSELRCKVYLETQEAVLYSGLTETYLAELAKAGTIKRIDNMRPFRYRRADLDVL